MTRCPIPMICSPISRCLLTNCIGLSPLSNASLNCRAAPSNAPPNRSPYRNLFINIWFLDSFNLTALSFAYTKRSKLICNISLIINIAVLRVNSHLNKKLKLDFYSIFSPKIVMKLTLIWQKILTIVNKPETKDDIKSFPARAHTIVLWAPLTAGPWSAVIIKHISINLFA